jgi:hypothetical protein
MIHCGGAIVICRVLLPLWCESYGEEQDMNVAARKRVTRAVSGVLAAATATLAVSALTPAPANAAFSQEWRNNSTYRASKDFIPSTTRLWAWGMACSAGDAISFVLQVTRTNDNHVMLTTSPRTANDTYIKVDDIGVRTGTAYYIRWYGMGKDSGGTLGQGYSAPCQGVQATW